MTTYWIVNIVTVFFVCVCCAGFLIPQILLVAYRKDLMDMPDERKIHHLAVPRLGGFAFKPVIFLSIALCIGVNIVLGYSGIYSAFHGEVSPLAFLFSAIMILYLVGMADDLIGIRYRAKFIVQIICACFMIASGVWFKDLHGVLGIHALTPWAGYPLTALIVVFIINAINLIDGIDGLASGLCSCALLVYGVAFFLLEDYAYAMLSFATLGVLVPFFYYNVFGNPEKGQKIFMGDTGSLTVGMIISFLSVRLSIGFDGMIADFNPMIIAFVPLTIPCLDVVRVYLRRVKNHKNPFLPDKNHIHHKLLALGIGSREVMLLIICISIFITVTNVILSKVMNINLLVILDIIVWTLVNIWLSKKITKK